MSIKSINKIVKNLWGFSMKKYSLLLSVVVSLSIFSGCGGGSSSSSSVSGRVIDDYISGGEVCIDANDDGVSNDTVCTTTDNNGIFTFSSVPAHPLIMDCTASSSSCIDIATEKAFTGKLTAPAGSLVLNSLTTLVQEYKRAEPTKSVEDIESEIKTQLGLSADIDLKTYDPIAKAYDAEGQKVLAAQTKIQVLLTGIAKAKDADMTAVATAVSKSLIEDKLTSTSLVESDNIKDILNDVNSLGSLAVGEADTTAENLSQFLAVVSDESNRTKAAEVIAALDDKVDVIKTEDINVTEVVEDQNITVPEPEAPTDDTDETTGGGSE